MIVKFCNKSHNPFFGKAKIQLCGLDYYKSTDNDFIRDVDEGRITRTLPPQTSPLNITSDELSALTGISIVGKGARHKFWGEFKTNMTIPNAYVFCTSRISKPTQEIADSLGYNSSYVIKEADQFCEIIKHEIWRQDPKAPNVVGFHGPVKYQDEKEVVYPNSSGFLESLHSIHPRIYLRKRRTSTQNDLKVYENEQEYRFVFLLVGQDEIMMPLTENKIHLDSNCVLSVLENGSI